MPHVPSDGSQIATFPFSCSSASIMETQGQIFWGELGSRYFGGSCHMFHLMGAKSPPCPFSCSSASIMETQGQIFWGGGVAEKRKNFWPFHLPFICPWVSEDASSACSITQLIIISINYRSQLIIMYFQL